VSLNIRFSEITYQKWISLWYCYSHVLILAIFFLFQNATQPISFTRFLCWKFVVSFTLFVNSLIPCLSWALWITWIHINHIHKVIMFFIIYSFCSKLIVTLSFQCIINYIEKLQHSNKISWKNKSCMRNGVNYCTNITKLDKS
jgi:hypothetical protein